MNDTEKLMTEGSELWAKIFQPQKLSDYQLQQIKDVIELMRKICPNYPQDNNVKPI